MINSDTTAAAVTGEYVQLDGERYFRIANSHEMPDFFMSLVGASDHWMFISSSGALTAGRQNSDLALFPYASDDQISVARAHTGSTTLVRVAAQQAEVWEPFAAQPLRNDDIRRNLYKTPLGNKLIFEEINQTLQLAFRYRWTFSEKFGFVRSCRFENLAQESQSVDLLDGLRNVLPYGINTEFQMRYSNLGNAYKKNELLPDSLIGIYCLSSIPTDRAEPSEALQATTIWQSGLTPSATLLSTEQVLLFRDGHAVQTETDVRGKAGAYLVKHSADLGSREELNWQIVAEVAQDHSNIVELDNWLSKTSNPAEIVAEDIRNSEQEFLRIISSSDAIQCSRNQRRASRHLSNTVFNVMRGGIPLEDYRIHSDDFVQHIASFNRDSFQRNESFLSSLPDTIDAAELRHQIKDLDDSALTRLSLEYIPLAFSRRHGDPTRPWNQFSIDLRSEDGGTNLNYQGNWRDIFQNWEALGLSFPEFFTSMICRFVNATTADGYNPYRITKDGFDWEEPTPEDPWANIGYWGDHQIIYLLKLLEWTRQFKPEALCELLNSSVFVHANVPYRIKGFDDVRSNPRDTIEFDASLSQKIEDRVASLGADGKLLRNQHDEIQSATLLEKLLTLSLAKLANFIPDGGIWLNTQRPEWNDANNALVGNGLSMVTTCYLHRWFQFLHNWISDGKHDSFNVSDEVIACFNRMGDLLQQHVGALREVANPQRRADLAEGLSRAGCDFRSTLYGDGFSGKTGILTQDECLTFFDTARRHLEVTIRNNERSDGLYHSYNVLDWDDKTIEVEHLDEMLEGQVAVLSSGLLTPTETVRLLDTLRQSRLYRANQNSYLLYPDRQLPRFLDKNQLDRKLVDSCPLLQALVKASDESIVHRDTNGDFHFNGQFRNSSDLRAAIDNLGSDYDVLVEGDGAEAVQLFEDLFDHRKFTGRSGTFFGYEGLGSIYWHMVSKLGLAVSENFFKAVQLHEPLETIESLRKHYAAIRAGIGAEKSPQEYGAFPSDPYSHTPENAGVKQPGMTGQVKEDLLARFTEIGVHIEDGCLCFRLPLFDREELTAEAGGFTFCDLAGKFRTIRVPQRGFGFTLFQVPFTYQSGDTDSILVHFADGKQQAFHGVRIDEITSRLLFSRSGEIIKVECQFTALRD